MAPVANGLRVRQEKPWTTATQPSRRYTQRERREGNPELREPPSHGRLVVRSPVECSLEIERGLKTLLRILCETGPYYALKWRPNID